MKKYILLVGLFLSAAVTCAQGQLGIQLSPSISINRVYTNPNNAGFSSAGADFRSKLGPIYDHPIQDNCYASTGLLYSVQHLAIKNKKLSPDIREKHVLHYLQVPLLLRLYTSELTLDTRLYALLGALGQIRVNARNTELQASRDQLFIEEFCRWGLAGLLGVGVEYNTSLSTSVFVGISYQYGVSSVIDKQAQNPPSSPVMGYSDLLSIDLGIRF
jgi:Outer membrane protein beta-barrel domain